MTLILKPLPSRVGFFQTAAGGGGSSGAFYELLDRSVLTGASDTMSVSFTAKDNLLILIYDINNGGNVKPKMRFVNASGVDSSTNYESRYSDNGGSDGTSINQSEIDMRMGELESPAFSATYMANISAEEKLFTSTNVIQNTAGAGNVNSRGEVVAKWANTSYAASRIDLIKTASGNFGTGSEIVVLGYNNDEPENNTWEELANNDETSGDNTATFTAKKYLLVEFFAENSGTIQPELIMGSGGSIDTGTNFASRGSVNAAADWTKISQDSIETNDSTGNPIFCQFFICNISDQEKLAIGHYNWRYTAGAGTSPGIIQVCGKWANTSAQCDILGFKNAGAGSFGASNLRIWGFD